MIFRLLAVAGLTAWSIQALPQTLTHGGDLSGVWTNDPPPEHSAFQNFAFSTEPPAMTAAGRARFEANKPNRGARAVAIAESDDPVFQCFPPGTPRIYFHPFPMEIIQTPGRVLMVFEYDHLVRQIYTDGREHRTDLAPSWMGDSIGHWEGEVLVVETNNFNDKTWLDRRGLPHSEALTVTERFELIEDGDRLRIDIRVDDPETFAEPWSAQRYYRKTDWQIEEFACMDNVNFEAYEEAVLDFGE